jgi:hypothetical protein
MTRHRYAGWATAFALLATLAIAACVRDDMPDGNLPGIGSDGSPSTGDADSGASEMHPVPDSTENPGPGGGGNQDPNGGNGGPRPGGNGDGDGDGDGNGAGDGDGDSSDDGDGDSDMSGSGAAGSCVPASSVDADGPFTPKRMENVGPSRGSWVFYPEELGKDGMLHPVFTWGPGAGTGPMQYTDHLNRLASHGFVVISQRSSGRGDTEKAALDWLLAENEKPGSTFYQKLDPKRVGAGGHSLGSLTTMAMASDPRLSLYVLVCGGCMSGRGGCGAADIHGPTVILGGDTDTGTPNYEGDYKEIQSPVVFLTKDNTGHIACARNNLSPWVAFMRWQFCGEEELRPKFFQGGEYCTKPWECKSKNF